MIDMFGELNSMTIRKNKIISLSKNNMKVWITQRNVEKFNNLKMLHIRTFDPENGNYIHLGDWNIKDTGKLIYTDKSKRNFLLVNLKKVR